MGIFAVDCAKVPKHSAITYWKALHTRRSTETRFGVGETSPISSRKHDIGLYLWMRPNRNSELDAMGGVLEAGILRIIPEVTTGTYVFP